MPIDAVTPSEENVYIVAKFGAVIYGISRVKHII